LEGLAMDNVCIFYGHFVYFTAKWDILWSFGSFSGQLVYFSPFLVCFTRKNLATLVGGLERKLQTVWQIETCSCCRLKF
jgi:hypothetical protein